MSLPGTAAIPAGDPARARAAEATGARAVELAREGLRPSQIVTAEALDNAITVLMALGGGTNAVVHLLALAGPRRRAARPSIASTSSRAARRCSRTCGRRASTCSRTSIAPVASARCCTSSRRCCTRTR